ncbi:MAG: alkane 1-monooxygenase, partial [Catenulispora sp.]|nr:alkane 1-monooxygenase [Catenulispora sp.]
MTAIAASGPAGSSSAQSSWRDGKKFLWPLGLLVPTIPWIAWGLAAATGWGVAWWAGPILVFGVFPFFDWAIGKDSDNPPDSVLAFLEG